MENISGQKFETTWLGQNNDPNVYQPLEKNENGEYQILLDIEEEMRAIRTSKEGKAAEKENA